MRPNGGEMSPLDALRCKSSAARTSRNGVGTAAAAHDFYTAACGFYFAALRLG
jgi:hypothetical protein